MPPTTAVVDAAVELFAQLLPLQESTISVRTINILLEAVRSSKLEKNIGRRVVSNRDPHRRAGCALAFGAIYSYVGGLAAGRLLKTSVNVLMSSSNDPHLVVHFWALKLLATVINAASLGYAPFVSSTLGMLLKVYMLDWHERESKCFGHAQNNYFIRMGPVTCRQRVANLLGKCHQAP